MELNHAIEQARALTRQLKSALDTQDLEQWLSLLDSRGWAMGAFEAAHRAAHDSERDACRVDLLALQQEDEELRQYSEQVLEQLAGEFRTQLKRPAHAGNAAGNNDLQACLDRKA